MIWFDLVTPKSVMFFKNIIFELQKRNYELLITTRGGVGYEETTELLELYNMNYVNIGNFGGSELKDKLKASLHRQIAFMEFISEHNIEKLVCLSSVDANRVAFGLNIPIVNFYDIPLSDCKSDFTKALPQARLSLPLSNRIIKPFVVPDAIFERFSIDKSNITSYNFLDPVIWLNDFIPDKKRFETLLERYEIHDGKKVIVVREEEYKSSYVDRKYPFLYETLQQIKDEFDAHIVIIPRYEVEYLKTEFPYAKVLEEKIVIQHLLAFADLFIGGGGTINNEATYFGTPTISTRSFVSHYDKFQIDKNLMTWVSNKEQLLAAVAENIGSRREGVSKEVYGNMHVDLDMLIDNILS